MDLEKLRVFFIVANHGSIQKASEALHIAPSAVSRSIHMLEDSVQNKLFIRQHTKGKGMSLTSAGEFLYKNSKSIFKLTNETESAIKEFEKQPSGDLKVISTPGLMNYWIFQFIPGFIKTYPHINLNLHSSTDFSLINSHSDVSISTYQDTSEDIVQVLLRSFKYKIYASKKYLETFGTPQKPEDLDNHHLISYSFDSPNNLRVANWLLNFGATSKNPRKPFLQINTTDNLYQCIECGIGIGTLVDEISPKKSKDIIEILPEYDGMTWELYYCYWRHMQHSKRVTALLDSILSDLQNKKSNSKN